MLRRHLNFRQISHTFTYYVLKYDNFKSVEVQGWTPLEILIFLHWTCRPTFTTLLGKRCAISHLMAVPKKRGKCKSATISLHRGDSLSASPPELALETEWRPLVMLTFLYFFFLAPYFFPFFPSFASSFSFFLSFFLLFSFPFFFLLVPPKNSRLIKKRS